MSARRLRFGLTDHERRVLDQRRRLRNCMWALLACILIVGAITA